MINIQPLTQLQSDDLYRLVTGYTADTKYAVRKTESDQHWVLTLELVPVTPPYRKHYDHLDGQTVAQYQQYASIAGLVSILPAWIFPITRMTISRMAKSPCL